jgi:D-sedoheptulose 7-phosphate isomerase
MSIANLIQRNIEEHKNTIEHCAQSQMEVIQTIGQKLVKSLRNGGTIFWCGNGGSAADSQHLSAELVGRFKKNRRPLRSLALSTDTSALTCIANDFSYDDVFSRQIQAMGRAGDVLVGISTSGNSENVGRAIIAANEIGVLTVALLGKGGGKIQKIATDSLVVPSETTARIQEVHILVGHILCDIIELEMGFA